MLSIVGGTTATFAHVYMWRCGSSNTGPQSDHEYPLSIIEGYAQSDYSSRHTAGGRSNSPSHRPQPVSASQMTLVWAVLHLPTDISDRENTLRHRQDAEDTLSRRSLTNVVPNVARSYPRGTEACNNLLIQHISIEEEEVTAQLIKESITELVIANILRLQFDIPDFNCIL
uniref:Uncharacterized protein n=1 Tax=Ditylenchus dipsaci TaxID=166011 RepID=A0A915E8H5_9BILA